MKFLIESIDKDLISMISKDVTSRFNLSEGGSCIPVSDYIEKNYGLNKVKVIVQGKDPIEIISRKSHYVNQLDDNHLIDFTIKQYSNYESLKDKAITIPVIADKLKGLDEYTSDYVHYISEE